jgi:hypothetical protein
MSSKSTRQTVATNTVTVGALGSDAYLNSVCAQYTSNATVGNRQLVLQVLDSSSNVMYQFSAGIVQAASLVRFYNFMAGVAREAAFVNGELMVPIPFDIIIPQGGSVKVFDSAAIAAGDSMVVSAALEAVRQ